MNCRGGLRFVQQSHMHGSYFTIDYSCPTNTINGICQTLVGGLIRDRTSLTLVHVLPDLDMSWR